MLPFLRELSRELDVQVEQAELRGLANNATDGAFLLLALAALYLLTPGTHVLRPTVMATAFGVFATLSVALRFIPRFRRETRLKTGLLLVAMVAFITSFLFAIDTQPSQLLILYLLPVIISALMLGRGATLAVTLAGVLSFLLAAGLRDPMGVPTGRAVVELAIGLAPFLLVAYVTALLAHEINTAKLRIRGLSETDDLTGLANLRAFARVHRREHEQALRNGRAYSIVVMDLNRLKHINDTYGHETGNRAIVLFANVIARLVRSTDLAARYGGDEFIVLLPESGADDARRVTHRIRAAVERCTIEVSGQMLRLSVSLGTATFPGDAQDSRELIVAADQAMYRDKRARQRLLEESEAPAAEVVTLQ
jgi:diguanylate cyclase (GGDEF)-like protein